VTKLLISYIKLTSYEKKDGPNTKEAKQSLDPKLLKQAIE